VAKTKKKRQTTSVQRTITITLTSAPAMNRANHKRYARQTNEFAEVLHSLIGWAQTMIQPPGVSVLVRRGDDE
jgi:hypothetical protein